MRDKTIMFNSYIMACFEKKTVYPDKSHAWIKRDGGWGQDAPEKNCKYFFNSLDISNWTHLKRMDYL